MRTRQSPEKRKRSTRRTPDPDAMVNAISGKTRGENARIVIARRAFMDTLVAMPAVESACARWAKRYGLARQAERLQRLGDRLAHDLALDSRGSLFLQDSRLDVSDLSPQTVADITRLRTACVQFWQRVDSLSSSFFHDVRRFVTDDLRLPWPFVVADLCEYFVIGLWRHASGLPYHRRAWWDPKPVALPAMTITSPSEILAAYERARHPLPPGKTNLKAVPRYAEWLVRHHVGGATLLDLFYDYHRTTYHPERTCDAACPDDHRLVSLGIREAQRLLELHQYRYRLPLGKSEREK